MNSLEHAALSGALTSIGLQDSPDPDGREPVRSDDESTAKLLDDKDDENDNEDEDKNASYPALNSPDLDQLLDDSSHCPSSLMMSRGWSGNTGPKGVLLDFKASHGKSGAILGGSPVHHHSLSFSRKSAVFGSPSVRHKSSRTTSPASGDSDSDSDPNHSHLPIYSNKRSNRFIISPHRRKPYGSPPSPPTSISTTTPVYSASKARCDSRNRKLFGHLREVGVDNFIQAVEAEKDDNEIIVLIHLYDPALESCVNLNSHLSNMARLYPRTKFLRALASELDFFNTSSPSSRRDAFTLPILATSPGLSIDGIDLNDPFHEPSCVHHCESRTRRATDSDVLPTLIWYRAGEYVQSLPALERELPSGVVDRSDKSYKELQMLLFRYGIIHDLNPRRQTWDDRAQ